MFRRIAVASLIWGSLLSANALAKPVELTILHTNDTHDHLESFNAKWGKNIGGVARRATLIRDVKDHARNVLVLDAGDVFQGTPLFTFFNGEADYKTMAMLGYDATTVGNHDMDNGLANLEKQAEFLHFPILSCNFVDQHNELIFPAYHVFERGGLKIAVVGIMGEGAYEAIADKQRKGVKVLDPATVLKRIVPELRKQADLVVVVSHTGHEEEIQLAKDVPGIDVIVGGHSHTLVPHPVAVKNGDRTCLVVQAYQWGEYVGRIDMTVDHGKIEKYSGELLPVSTAYAPDPKVASVLSTYTTQIAKQMNVVVGRSAVEFTNSNKSDGDTPLGDVIADMLREEGQTDIGIMNSGGIRSGLPQGDLTRGMIYSMLPFENRLVTFKVTGAQLDGIVAWAAAKLGHAGTVQVSGLRFSGKDGHPVDVTVNGAPIDPARTYSIATIDYLASGNDGAGIFSHIKDVHSTGVLLRDAMFDYLKKHATLTQPAGDRIHKL